MYECDVTALELHALHRCISRYILVGSHVSVTLRTRAECCCGKYYHMFERRDACLVMDVHCVAD